MTQALYASARAGWAAAEIECFNSGRSYWTSVRHEKRGWCFARGAA